MKESGENISLVTKDYIPGSDQPEGLPVSAGDYVKVC